MKTWAEQKLIEHNNNYMSARADLNNNCEWRTEEDYENDMTAYSSELDGSVIYAKWGELSLTNLAI